MCYGTTSTRNTYSEPGAGWRSGNDESFESYETNGNRNGGRASDRRSAGTRRRGMSGKRMLAVSVLALPSTVVTGRAQATAIYTATVLARGSEYLSVFELPLDKVGPYKVREGPQMVRRTAARLVVRVVHLQPNAEDHAGAG